VDAARSLPPRAFLSVNISAAVALSSRDLAGILAAAERPIVLEVAEHADADDHEALRALVRSLPVPARLAMDDAGGGFTNLRRVMELAPDIVKVDRTLVQDIDRDPARQALLAGLRHFASRRGISLIAEGIETSSELATLVALGVSLGQGFLLGRPASVNEVSRVPAAAVVARLGPDAGGAVPPP
jgi:EAL domain-containing protein (putative c-di-GMP-specific phosphodiesterase class I)